MNHEAPATVRTGIIVLVSVILTAAGASVHAAENWVSNITGLSITSRSDPTGFVARADERCREGYFCIDVERTSSKVYGIFVRSPVITDCKVTYTNAWPFDVAPSAREDGWRLIDVEISGRGKPGELFYLAVYVKSEAITGNGYFARSDFDEFIERKRQSEDRGYYIVDYEWIDGSWWAITAKSDGLFSGHGTMSSRSSFDGLKDRMSELNESGKRMVDIERVDDTWYGFSINSDKVGSSGMFSRSSFDEFATQATELAKKGIYLIDLEIEGGDFFGLVVRGTSN